MRLTLRGHLAIWVRILTAIAFCTFLQICISANSVFNLPLYDMLFFPQIYL